MAECVYTDVAPFPSFENYTNVENVFSGDLDARKIDIIMNKYGIQRSISKKSRNSFLCIKNKRNGLAHGEISFSKASQGYSIYDIESIKKHILYSLKDISMAADEYIKNI